MALRDLRPPAVEDVDEEDSTWDSTFQRELSRKSAAGSSSICSHAVSVGSRVFGVSLPEHRASDAEPWWTWQRSLAEEARQSSSGPVGLVNCLTCNSDGTVIAAATDAGIVTLMRGSDGQILATRTVCAENFASVIIINLTWISAGDAEDDVLLIEAPSDNDGPSNLILVSNIRGNRLNHQNSAVVAEAARNMQILPLSPESSCRADSRDLRALTGCFHPGKTTIRLVACDCDGKLVVYDYDTPDRALRFVKGDIELLGGDAMVSTEWLIDFDVGLRTQTKYNKSFALFTAFLRHEAPRLFWFDPTALQTACHFKFPAIAAASPKSTKVMAMETVSTFVGGDALAVAVAVKSAIDGAPTCGTIHVVQVLLDETLGLTVLSNPHIVYTIPIDGATISLAMASIPSAPYAFRYKLWQSSVDDCVYKEFQPDDLICTTIGMIRSTLWRGDFDSADEMVAQAGLDTLRDDLYANFHPSEIALRRLQYSLTQGIPDAMEEAQLCLRRLASGAVLGSEKGLDLLLEAVSSVIQSPSHLSLENYCHGLTTLASTIQTVLQSIPHCNADKLQWKQDAIAEQLYALKFLSSAQAVPALSTPFHAILSTNQLFEILVRDHKFALAEALYRSNLKDRLSASALVLPLLKIDADVNPQDYIFLLSEVALPNLAVNDGLLSRLKAWTCRIADSLDDKNEEVLNLSAGIVLLQTVYKGNKELQLKIYSSFGSFSPFAESVGSRQVRRSPRINSSGQRNSSLSGEFSSSMGSSSPKSDRSSNIGPIQSSKKSIPTILELCAFQRGFTISKNGDETYDNGSEDCVKEKLIEALCLKEARILGLVKENSSLRDFEQNGGAQYVAKELVRHLSSLSATHVARVQLFSEKLTPFCDTFAICKDRSMLDCAIDLCHGKNVAARMIEESCSIARCCSSVTVRCQISLAVLRAALLCGYSHIDVGQLSKDAIAWASCDASLQSELEEASRLLQIDGIVLKYCGSGARELFRVDNPRHAMQLLEFVTQHVEKENALFDALSLCDGFHCLCPHLTAQRLLENAILHKNESLCILLMEKLVHKDISLAERAFISAIAFSEEILAECSNAIRSGCAFGRLEGYRRRARYASSRAGTLLLFALENSLNVSADLAPEIDCYLQDNSLEGLRDLFLGIERLQRDHSVYVSLAELLQMEIVVDRAAQFVEDIALSYASSDPKLLNTKLSAAKRVCSLLTVGSKIDESDVWVAASARIAKDMIKEHQDNQIFEFLSDVDFFADAQSWLHARAHISLAVALCDEAAQSSAGISTLAGIQLTAKAASLMKDWSILRSDGKVLAAIVEFAGHLDLVCEVFARFDEGVGESADSFRRKLQSRSWLRTCSSDANIDVPEDRLISFHRPLLHLSWYIGDGLLLPPNESLPTCLRYCKGLVDTCRGAVNSNSDLHELIAARGAHSLALRVLCQSATVHACYGTLRKDGALLADLQDAFDETVADLVERSLGGTGTGITSSVIDSQQALAFLLSLPVKQAFAAFKSCLPTALKTQNFARLFILSNIGMLASSGESNLDSSDPIFGLGWKRQRKFFDQCQRLSGKARWWAILQEFGVEFDSQLFQQSKAISKSHELDDGPRQDDSSTYAASLMPLMIAKMIKTMSSSDVLRLTALYADTFHLHRDLVCRSHIEYLLSPAKLAAGDRRFDLTRCETTVRASLQMLNPPLKRAAVLRQCLLTLDTSETSGEDYERYSLVLNLFQEVLTYFVDHDVTIRPDSFEAELEVIDRRRDALAILSAFFQGERLSMRPQFSKFFSPLHKTFNSYAPNASANDGCGILGNFSSRTDAAFDPLQPLERFLSTTHDMAAVTALAPLCIPLGLPQGYIHARLLVARFRRSRANNVEFPSFENDVTPVLNRILSPSDRSDLAEWCAEQYDRNDTEKLKCIGVVLRSSIQASTDTEQRRRLNPNDKVLEKQELDALDTVKRISSAKAVLSDMLRVKAMLLSSDCSWNGAVKQLSERLITYIDRRLQECPDMSPEVLIDCLYETGSLLAAQLCLNSNESLPVGHFRRFCSTVHAACQSVADQHSHIDPNQRARRFAQRWLFHGDEIRLVSSTDGALQEPVVTSGLDDIDEENTMDFVMDLTTCEAAEDGWGTDSAEGKNESTKERRLVSADEASALLCCSLQELSEAACQRAALRIAFVMAFSGASPSISDGATAKENLDANLPRSNTSSRVGLLAQLHTKRDTRHDSYMFDLSSELLRIVFARSGASSNLMSRWHSFDSDTSIACTKREPPKSITFAMRHRALRAASILCPQEILDEAIRSEGYDRSSKSAQCTLCRCSFGAFVAKEIEEMGLNLPHSDLLSLSEMHFLSYARTLWRHHRDDPVVGDCKGRLLLLLVELSLQRDDTDVSFVLNVLDEMVRLNLTRSLLLSLEHVAKYLERVGLSKALAGESILKAISAVVVAIMSEVRILLSDTSTVDQARSSVSTESFERLFKIAPAFLGPELMCEHFAKYMGLLTASSNIANNHVADMLVQIIARARTRADRYFSAQRREIKVHNVSGL